MTGRALLYLSTMAACLQAGEPESPQSRQLSVRAFGALGDGVTDDTTAFQKALDAAGETGAAVCIDPVAPGLGYVLTHTVRLPPGTSLIGAPAGMPFFLWEGVPRAKQRGCVVLARPAEEQYRGETRQPLFELGGGNTVRGLYILYDQQPWPSDADLERPDTLYPYAGFEAFRERFVADHARPYGPTFYGAHAASVTLEDITCHGYWDFVLFKVAGKVFIERIYLYGYGRAFALQEGPDTVRIRGIHLVPNVSTAISWQHSRLHAAIVWRPENTAFEFGAVDGYTVSDVVAFLVHTGFRLGASAERPFANPVTGEHFVTPWGRGPWGSVENAKLDNVAVGFDAVTGTILPNQMHNVMVHVSLPTAERLSSDGGEVARAAAFVIGPGFAGATLQVANLAVSSFAPTRVLAGAQMVQQSNGRVFLLACPGDDRPLDYADRRRAHLEINGLVLSNVPANQVLGQTPDNRAELRVTGFIHNGVRNADLMAAKPDPAVQSGGTQGQ
jgi:hypothetical protein